VRSSQRAARAVRYADYWGITERQAQREWERYRRAFGEPDDPSIEELGRFVLSELSGQLPSKPRELPSLGVLGVRAPSAVIARLALHGGAATPRTRRRTAAPSSLA